MASALPGVTPLKVTPVFRFYRMDLRVQTHLSSELQALLGCPGGCWDPAHASHISTQLVELFMSHSHCIAPQEYLVWLRTGSAVEDELLSVDAHALNPVIKATAINSLMIFIHWLLNKVYYLNNSWFHPTSTHFVDFKQLIPSLNIWNHKIKPFQPQIIPALFIERELYQVTLPFKM